MTLPVWLLKIGFHLLYNQLACTYDLVAWLVSFGQWAAWRRLALPFLRPGPTLELAYGTGGFFADMQAAGQQPVGVDLSPFMARLAQTRLRRQGLPANLSRGRAQRLPFRADYFTNVVATFPTNYIFEADTLAEVYRVLAPGGQLVVVFQGQLRGPWPARPLVDWLYQITSQRSEQPLRPLPVFAACGLPAQWQTVERHGVAASLLFASKL